MRRVGCLLAAVLLCWSPTASAAERPVARAALPAPKRWFSIGVGHELRWPPVRAALVTCEPLGGTHPNPAAACTKIISVRGDLGRLPTPPRTFCVDDYDPYLVYTMGTWDGAQLSSSRIFTNRCWMQSIAGVLVNF
ncbi:hypothetical protein Sru01_58490 [Sphaerisporangium rufum]|uniref:Subtilisin inhibitor domain-containing protein n=1 Tax=Sphaerisporangium rufum TaxID=1381558 RepID=A0A919R715_9ACTN|nr:SSI family serine proteinase inhibitor [Sphaerisporangium rufum]GII80867.1 hypothetical protein Sru01_58490 [Sphaerisporangium rufum]